MGTAALSRGVRAVPRSPQVDAFFEPRTCSVQYVVADPATRRCALIDPVLDYDEKSGSVTTPRPTLCSPSSRTGTSHSSGSSTPTPMPTISRRRTT